MKTEENAKPNSISILLFSFRSKTHKLPCNLSCCVRRNLNEEFEKLDPFEEDVENVETFEDKKVENDPTDADTEESDDDTEFVPKKRKRRTKKKRPTYQNTIDLLWGRFRLSLTIIALAINTVCEDLGITDRSKYVSVTRITNLLKKFDEKLLITHAENNYGFPDAGKKQFLK